MKDEENPAPSLDVPLHPSSLIPHPFSTPFPVAAILLAAGRSRRMGAFKPLLPFGAHTVVETCVRNLLAAGACEVVVVVGHRGEEVRAHLSHLPVRLALNHEAESEMGVSVARGVEALSAGDAAEGAPSCETAAGAVLIALADHPAVGSAEIAEVCAAYRRTGARFVVPEWQGRGGHPVLVSLQLRASLLRLDAAGGLRALISAHASEVLRLPVASPFIARDMDTWEDYRALHEEVFGVPPPVTQT
ncbi:MAG TPA: nucleotidyltransferase family protein [Pyrinomonadaceae bacterium]|nr:nucleotidyltransferase family protein [Pyrinomonadaceae bacterium]